MTRITPATTPTTAPTADLEAIVDAGRVSRFQAGIIALCALVAMLDGFDTQAIAFVAPEIAAAWGVPAASFGPVFGAGLFGGLLGAMAFGMLGDRLGRKPTLVFAVLLFAVTSLATPWAQSILQLSIARFITGLGLGGALPSFIALTSEYAPKRLRVSLVGLMFCGFPIGAVLGGIASAKLIPAFGWASVFIAGGVLPLLILPVFIFLVPESMRFLALRQRKEKIAQILARMDRAAAWNGDISVPAGEHSAPVSRLFTESRAAATLLLWATLFLSLLFTYFLVNWIPVVARQGGMPIQGAVIAVAMLNLGAVVGCLVIGRLGRRFNPAHVIACGYGLGALVIALIAHAGLSVALLCTLTFVAGALSIGAQMCTVALCASFYDTFVRATGVGWAMGIGRIGAIMGPVLGGILLAAGTSVPSLFVFVGLTSLGAAATVFALGRLGLTRSSLAPVQPASVSAT